MNVQYISDDKGKIAGVFIPITEWNELMSKYKDIEQIGIPSWHIGEVRARLEDFKNRPDQTIDFDIAMDDIENEL